MYLNYFFLAKSVCLGLIVLFKGKGHLQMSFGFLLGILIGVHKLYHKSVKGPNGSLKIYSFEKI